MDEKKWWSSSVDHKKISLTIKSTVIFVPSLVVLLSVFGFNATPEDLTQLINQLAVLISGISLVWGLVRKIYSTRN